MIRGVCAKEIKERLYNIAASDSRVLYLLRESAKKRNPKAIKVSTQQWLNNFDLIEATLALIDQRTHLRRDVAVIPSYSETKTVQLITGPTQRNAALKNERHSVFKMYLEMLFEHNGDPKIFQNESQRGLKQKHYQQWIMPFHVDDNHFTVAVVKFDRRRQSALIQYYDSFGNDISADKKEDFLSVFKQQGYDVRFRCLSKPDQEDAVNCGLFAYLAGVKIASNNVGHTENFFNGMKEHYKPLMNYHRTQFIALLNGLGHHYAAAKDLATTPKWNPASLGKTESPVPKPKPSELQSFNKLKVAIIMACFISVFFLPMSVATTILAAATTFAYYRLRSQAPAAIDLTKDCDDCKKRTKPLAEPRRSALTFRSQKLPCVNRQKKAGGVAERVRRHFR